MKTKMRTKTMKSGDLVAVRFDCYNVVLGIITGRSFAQQDDPKGYAFICTSTHGNVICSGTSRRSQIVRVQLRNEEMFTNLCEVDWDDIKGRTPADRTKLRKWLKQMT